MVEKSIDIENKNPGFLSINAMIRIFFTESDLFIFDIDKLNQSRLDSECFRENYINIKTELEGFTLKIISNNNGKFFFIRSEKKNILEQIKNEINSYQTKYILEHYLSKKYKIIENDGTNIKMSISYEIEFYIHLLIPRLISDIGEFLEEFKNKINEQFKGKKDYMELYYKMFATLTEMNKKINYLGNISQKYMNQLKDKIKYEIKTNQNIDFEKYEEEEKNKNENDEKFNELFQKNFHFLRTNYSKEFERQFNRLKTLKNSNNFDNQKSLSHFSIINSLNHSLNDFIKYPKIERKSIPFKLESSNDFCQKLIAKISNPQNIKFNICMYEPLTILQRSCEKFFYPNLYKNKISLIPNDEDKLYNIVAFIINELSLNIKRFLSPIKPILNETYEYEDQNVGFKFLGEQVEENISAYIFELPDFKYYGNNNGFWKYNLINKMFEYQDREIRRIEIKCENEIIKFAYNVPILQLKNIIIGKPYFDYRGIVKIFINRENSKLNQSFAEITFSNKIKGDFEGKIYNNENNIKYLLQGNIYNNLYLIDVKKETKVLLWELNNEEQYLKNRIGHYHNHEYYLPNISYNLNNDNNEIMENIPLTDCRNRKDIREYEKGNISDANYYHKIISDCNNKKSLPLYFEKVNDNYGSYYKYKGNYWERKNRKINNNFNEEDEKIWNKKIFPSNKKEMIYNN